MQIDVVDDHSTADDPEDVVARLGGGRVGFHRHPENLGVVGNLNACLRRSRGEIVHLLHGDDLVLEGFYQTLDDRLREHPDAGAAYCRHLYMDERGRRLDVAPLEPPWSGILADGARFLATEQRIMTRASSSVARSTSSSAASTIGWRAPRTGRCGCAWLPASPSTSRSGRLPATGCTTTRTRVGTCATG